MSPARKPPAATLLLEQRMVDPTELTEHPMNSKLHNDALLRGSIRKGLFKPITVNIGTYTGRPMEILAGHGTRAAWIAEHPGEPIQVTVVDVDEDRGKEIMLIDNPGPGDPGHDDLLLAETLGSMEDLSLTGYDEDYLETLRRIIEATGGGNPTDEGGTDAKDEWWDMPDMPDVIDGVVPHRKLIVAFKTQEDVDQFISTLGIVLTSKTKSIWYPDRGDEQHQKSFRVVTADA